MADGGMVIVGAGETGARAALALREEGWTGPVTLVGEEAIGPYERPPLSKSVMTLAGEPAAVIILPPARLAEHAIRHVAGRAVIAIDRGARTIGLADGETIAYRTLLLATGARARLLSLPGGGGPAVHTLRTWADALALRPRLVAGARLAVIGGGFIGLEIAASAAARGCAVTVIEAGPRILMRGVPEDIASLLAGRHLQAGIALRTGAGIVAIEAEPGGARIRLADDTVVEADIVVAGIGAVPETALAAAAGLAIDNGIRVDGRLVTSDPDILAAGDCCSFPHPLYGGRRIRLEAWRNAQDQGAHAARAMLGATEAYAAVPWFWSDQHDLCLQVAGLPDEGVATVTRRDGEGLELRFHLDGDGRLVAASGLGPIGRIAKDIRLSELLIAQRARPDPVRLASVDVRLKSLLAA